MLIEDYGFIGDLQTARWSVVTGRSTGCACHASIRRRASRRCSATSGTGVGCWRRRASVGASSRRYRPGTLVLETEFETADGAVRVIDFMPRRARRARRG